jgi:hypothetical protein
MKINAYGCDEGWQYSGDVTFTYNPHFKLEKEEMNMPTFSNRYEYTYEEGLGNYTQLLMPGGGLVPVKYYPAPVKSAKVNLPQGHGGTEIPRASVSPW